MLTRHTYIYRALVSPGRVLAYMANGQCIGLKLEILFARSWVCFLLIPRTTVLITQLLGLMEDMGCPGSCKRSLIWAPLCSKTHAAPGILKSGSELTEVYAHENKARL